AEALVRELRGEPLDGATRDALRAILTAYRGGAAARYDRFAWMQAWAVRIRDFVCTAGVALAGDALATGAPDAALDYAREVAQIDPFDEAACEVAMRALIARDDVGGARRELDRYAAQLARELDASPPARLTALLRAG
ncbi:MAG: bacterial transcriptional activator domain-containing protein, partial [Candidatus Eremiobacteraeota bacterium]|nr:bacterial transcriptional activator domain-containing protein [Candidatus Eremiobacteraeota bacterium]